MMTQVFDNRLKSMIRFQATWLFCYGDKISEYKLALGALPGDDADRKESCKRQQKQKTL